MKNALVIISALVALCPLISFCQPTEDIRVLNPPQSIRPGSHFTLFIEVTGAASDQEASLSVPENWQIILTRQSEIRPGFLRYGYTIACPATTLSGPFQLTYKYRNREGKVVSKVVTLEVTSIRKLEIIPLSFYDFVKEGDTLQLNYLIQNQGNVREHLRLSTSKGKIFGMRDTLSLNPHKDTQVQVRYVVPQTDTNYWLLSNDLFVSLKDSANAVASFTAVPVYSTKNHKSDPYLRFPVEAGFWMSHFKGPGKGQSLFQYDVRGLGFLDIGKKHHLDFIAHGPRQLSFPAIGNLDQYSLNYVYQEKTRVSLGDYLLAFNHLMEFGRYGRGFRIDQTLGKAGVSAFFVQPRFYPTQRDTYGGRLYYKPSQKLTLSLDYLFKEARFNNQWLNTHSAGVSAFFRTTASSVYTEVALSGASGKWDWGFFNRASVRYKRLQLSSDLVYAGKNFYGFYNNSRQAVSTVSVYLSKKISVGLQSNFTRVNPGFDIYNPNTSPYFAINSLLLNYEISPAARIIASYTAEAKEDRQEVKKFDFKENYGRLAFMLQNKQFRFTAESRYGRAMNLLAANDDIKYSKSLRSGINTEARTLRWLWLGGFFEYQQNAKFDTLNRLTNYYYYGASGRVQAGSLFNASFTYRNNYAPDELIQKRSYLDFSSDLQTRRHKFTISIGKVFIPGFDLDNTLFFNVKYALRLNVPLARNKETGTLTGTLTGAANLRKSGVLVIAGNRRYLTGADGKFYFNDLPAGQYHVTIDRSTLEAGVISASNTPVVVRIDSKTSQEIALPITASGNVNGKVIFQNKDKQKTAPQPPVLIVKLYNAGEQLNARVNESGGFSFREILPGEWTLEVMVYGNQKQYEVEEPLRQIIITPGDAKEISFSLRLIERKIYFSNKNFNLNVQK